MNHTLPEDTNAMVRNKDRYSHISIRLRFRVNDKWETLDALEWNEVGFNFYHVHELHDPVLELKRGITRLDGTIVWRSPNANDDVVLATLVNELIFAKSKDLVNNVALQTRLIKLIRVTGMVAEKRKILASLGLDIADKKMAEMIAQRKQDRPMFHYGVKVLSNAWGEIVEKAFNVSSVLISLEKWSNALTRK